MYLYQKNVNYIKNQYFACYEVKAIKIYPTVHQV